MSNISPLEEASTQREITYAERVKDATRKTNLLSRDLARGDITPQLVDNVTEITPDTHAVYIFNNPEYFQAHQASFIPKERLMSGAADSAHAVIGGQLVVARKDEKPKVVEAAVKWYTKRSPEECFDRVTKEADIMLELAQIGLPVPELIGVVVSTQGHALISKYKRGLVTMDNVPWQRGLSRYNLDIAKRAASTLGYFNQLGFIHGDAKIKNIADVEKHGSTMIDFETSNRADMTIPYNAAWAAADLHKLLDSLRDKNFFVEKPRNNLTVDGAYTEIVDAYLEAWVDAPGTIQNAVLTAAA